MKNRFYLIMIISLLLLQNMWAQIPKTMSYQGVLMDANGVAVNGNVDLTFKLFDALTGGTLVWPVGTSGELHTNVSVKNGNFSVILGSITPLNILFDKQYWLEINVGTDVPLAPRSELTAAPYSLSERWSETNGNISRVNGNVGIGTSNPTKKLDVLGDAKFGTIYASGFVDKSGIRKFYSIPGNVFTPASSENSYTSDYSSLKFHPVQNGSNTFFAPVYIPHGASLWGISAIILDGGPSDVWITLLEINDNSPSSPRTLGSVRSQGNNNLPSQFSGSIAPNEKINGKSAYVLIIQCGGSDITNFYQLYKVTIEFSVEEL
jgi:hypothetical protein